MINRMNFESSDNVWNAFFILKDIGTELTSLGISQFLGYVIIKLRDWSDYHSGEKLTVNKLYPNLDLFLFSHR